MPGETTGNKQVPTGPSRGCPPAFRTRSSLRKLPGRIDHSSGCSAAVHGGGFTGRPARECPQTGSAFSLTVPVYRAGGRSSAPTSGKMWKEVENDQAKTHPGCQKPGGRRLTPFLPVQVLRPPASTIQPPIQSPTPKSQPHNVLLPVYTELGARCYKQNAEKVIFLALQGSRSPGPEFSPQ